MCVVQGPGGDFAADRTHRSTLAPDEVLAYLADRAKPTACEADVRATIAACDTSGDGLIDFGEVGRSIDRSRGRETSSRFHREGVNGNAHASTERA